MTNKKKPPEGAANAAGGHPRSADTRTEASPLMLPATPDESPDPRCGSAYGYAVHVRERTPKCDPCRRAHAERASTYYRRRYLNRGRPLLVDATGTHRRLQALAAIGWATRPLAAKVGVTPTAIKQWMRRELVQPKTAARVAELYDELWNQPGPSVKGRAHARRMGWPSPLAWDDDTIDDPAARPNRGHQLPLAFDEVAVQRAMHGDAVKLRPVERAEVVRRLTAAGYSAAEIAARVDIDQRSVQRIRDQHRAAA